MSERAAGLRNSSLIDPRGGRSVRALATSMGFTGPVSVRDLLARRDRVRVQRWAVVLMRYTDVPVKDTHPALTADFLDWAFYDPDGVAAYIRTMSGGRRLVEWQAFGPYALMTIAQKRAITAGGEATLYRKLLQDRGVPVADFDRFMWVIDEPASGGGTADGATGDRFVGGKDFSPQLASHELVHAFGVCSHADRYVLDDYADPFCVMGRGSIARSFENTRLTRPGNRTHATTGPSLLPVFQLQAGWLSYPANVIQVPGPDGVHTLTANQGAPPEQYTEKVALTIGALPVRPGDPTQLWLEYRHPSGFDRRINAPVAQSTADLGPDGALVLHVVGYGSARCTDKQYARVLEWCPAAPGRSVDLPQLGTATVTAVDPARRTLTVALKGR